MTSKGQVVIPSKIRKKFGIKIGTKIHFSDEGKVIKIIPVTKEIIDQNAGILETKGKLLRALMKEKKREREL